MRPFDQKRLVVEYARIHRIVPLGPLFAIPNFVNDLAGHLQQAIDAQYTTPWRGHDWKLGNLSLRDEQELSGQFGWSESRSDPNALPPYHDGVWDETPQQTIRGELAVFVVDAASQRVAITSRAGDVKTAGFCRSLTALLVDQEISLRTTDGERPGGIEWLVEPVAETGVFRSWLQSVTRVKQLSISFHLPNPSPDDEIIPLVNVLKEAVGTNGLLRITNDVGDSINPFGNEIVAAGVAMQEHDYGSITAKGETEDGTEAPFRSSTHTAKDDMDDPPWTGTPTIREAITIMYTAIRARVSREKPTDG